MSFQRIDRLEEIDLSTVTCAEMRWQYSTGVAITTGQGAYKKNGYRSGAMTKLGDIEEHIWYIAMEYIVQRDKEEDLLNALIEWEREHGFSCNEKERRQKALEKYSMRLFDSEAWVSYLPFNRRYRPQALAQASIRKAIFDCCDIPGEVTQAQIDRAYTGRISCPHCGCWSTFILLDAEDAPWQDRRTQE